MKKFKINNYVLKNLLKELIKYRCISTLLVRAKVLSSMASRFITKCLSFEKSLKKLVLDNKDGKEVKGKEVEKFENQDMYVRYIRYVNSFGFQSLFADIRSICQELISKNCVSGYFQIIRQYIRKGDNGTVVYIKFASLDIFERPKTHLNKGEVIRKDKVRSKKRKFVDKLNKNKDKVKLDGQKGGRVHRTQSR